jgi:hypothetical protein
MPKWYHPDILDNGLAHVEAQIDASHTVKLHYLKAYAAADSYATVAGNSIGSVALAGADLALSDQGTNGRQLTVAAKNITATADSGATPDTHVAILDETDSKVLIVTDETSDAQILTGNIIAVPSWNAKMNQPV